MTGERGYFKPRMRSFKRKIKVISPSVKVAYHCDGQIFEIIEDLFEAGVEVLNPAFMDPAKAK